MAQVYRGRVGVSIEAVQRLHEPASLPTEVKEVLAMFGRGMRLKARRLMKMGTWIPTSQRSTISFSALLWGLRRNWATFPSMSSGPQRKDYEAFEPYQ